MALTPPNAGAAPAVPPIPTTEPPHRGRAARPPVSPPRRRRRVHGAAPALLLGLLAATAGGLAASPAASATPVVTGVSVLSPPASPTVALDAPDPDLVLSGSTFYAFTTGTAWGNNLGALVDTSGNPTAGWKTASGTAYGSSALPDPPGWEQPGTQTSPGVFFWGGRWIMYYDAATAGSAGDTGHDCLAMATATTLSPPDFSDRSSGPFYCQPSFGGSIDPSPFIDPATGDAWLVWKSNDGGSSQPAHLWSAELNASGTGFVTQPVELLSNDTTAHPWEATVENPQMVAVDGAYLLLFSGGLWSSSGYAEGFATCAGPQGPCAQPQPGPFLSSYGNVAGPGGASVTEGPGGTLWLAYAAWDSGCVGYGACGGTAARQLYVASLSVSVSASGGSGSFGAEPLAGNVRIVAAAGTPDGLGYWEASSSGGVYSYGDAGYHGSIPGLPPAWQPGVPVVGMAVTPDGGGYWEVTSTGAVYCFGDATFHGSTDGLALAQPVVGMAATPDGGGYWLVAADGGIFAFGDAAFYGSTGGLALAQPVVGMAATPDGGGYWLVAADGAVFAFGDAGFYGSLSGLPLSGPIVSITPTADGGGYTLVASDGGVFSFGDAGFYGSAGGVALPGPVVGMARTPDDGGYWLVTSDGSVFSFGDAGFYGSAVGGPL